jgi:hypothetical protein
MGGELQAGGEEQMNAARSQSARLTETDAARRPAAGALLCLLLLAGTALAEQPKTVPQSLDDAGNSAGKSVAETASCWLVDVSW